MSSANSETLLLLFQSRFLLFLFLLWLLWLKLPKLCWIVVVRVGTLVLFLTLREILSVFSVCCGFVICGFYYAEVCSFYSCFLEGFFFLIINGCWVLSKAFSAYIEIIIWLLLFNLLIVVYYIDWFADIEESLHPWDKAHLVMMYDLFNMLLDCVC